MKKIIIVETEVDKTTKRNKLYAKMLGVIFGGIIIMGMLFQLIESIQG